MRVCHIDECDKGMFNLLTNRFKCSHLTYNPENQVIRY